MYSPLLLLLSFAYKLNPHCACKANYANDPSAAFSLFYRLKKKKKRGKKKSSSSCCFFRSRNPLIIVWILSTLSCHERLLFRRHSREGVVIRKSELQAWLSVKKHRRHCCRRLFCSPTAAPSPSFSSSFSPSPSSSSPSSSSFCFFLFFLFFDPFHLGSHVQTRRSHKNNRPMCVFLLNITTTSRCASKKKQKHSQMIFLSYVKCYKVKYQSPLTLFWLQTYFSSVNGKH